MEERDNCFQVVFLSLNILITVTTLRRICEGLFEVYATKQRPPQKRPASYLAEEAVLLQLSIKPSAANMFPTSGSDGGLSARSRTLAFKDTNSRSEGTRIFRLCLTFQLFPTTTAVCNRPACLANSRTPAVKVQRGFSCVTNEITSHINLVKACPLPHISGVAPPLSCRQFQKSEYKKH